MDLISGRHPLIIVVGSGGVGKTTLAASLGVLSAREGRDTLVMTFDPSLRLKQTLGVGEEAKLKEVPVALDAPGALHASLLDARLTFDRLIERYAPDEESRRRVLENRFYQHLSGTLGGILEYMAVERLFEVAGDGRYGQIVLDTPPTRQALDFLEAPKRIVGFLESGALRVALKPWFDEEGPPPRRLQVGSPGPPGRALPRRRRGHGPAARHGRVLPGLRPPLRGLPAARPGRGGAAALAQDSLRAGDRPGRGAHPRHPLLRPPPGRGRLQPGADRGQPRPPPLRGRTATPPTSHDPCRPTGWELLSWAGERDRRGLVELAKLLSREQPLVDVPLQPDEPTDLPALESLGRLLESRLSEWERYVSRTS